MFVLLAIVKFIRYLEEAEKVKVLNLDVVRWLGRKTAKEIH